MTKAIPLACALSVEVYGIFMSEGGDLFERMYRGSASAEGGDVITEEIDRETKVASQRI